MPLQQPGSTGQENLPGHSASATNLTHTGPSPPCLTLLLLVSFQHTAVFHYSGCIDEPLHNADELQMANGRILGTGLPGQLAACFLCLLGVQIALMSSEKMILCQMDASWPHVLLLAMWRVVMLLQSRLVGLFSVWDDNVIQCRKFEDCACRLSACKA